MKNTLPVGNSEPRTAVLVDCDNVSPGILEYAQLMAAQFGRIVLRRGYGNQATLGTRWQETLLRQAFTPCLQYQYVNGKNTSDIALSLDAQEALFDERVETICLVTSDSDFTYLCRKLRERGATVCIVGEAKTPAPLRNACDRFFEWVPEVIDKKETTEKTPVATSAKTNQKQEVVAKGRPLSLVKAVSQLVSEDSTNGEVDLSTLGQYLKRTDSGFSPKNYGHASLLNMIKTYDLLTVRQENGGHWVSLAADAKKKLQQDGVSVPPSNE